MGWEEGFLKKKDPVNRIFFYLVAGTGFEPVTFGL